MYNHTIVIVKWQRRDLYASTKATSKAFNNLVVKNKGQKASVTADVVWAFIKHQNTLNFLVLKAVAMVIAYIHVAFSIHVLCTATWLFFLLSHS